MAKVSITEKLARTSVRRPWLVVGLWALLFVAGGFFASGIGNVLTTEGGVTVETESRRGDRLIEQRLHRDLYTQEFVIVRSDAWTAADGPFRDFVDGLTAEIRAQVGVAGVANYYESNEPQMVSADGHTTVIVVNMADENGEPASVEPVLETVRDANGEGGFRALTAGNGSLTRTFTEISERDLQRGEMLALPIAVIILLLVFGAAVAAGVPILVAIVSIVVSVGISALVGQLFDLSFFVVNMITMIGLAVGIDYSLFIIHRVRDERAAGLDVDSAVTRAGATASRAVLFSGATVIVALAGLFIVPTSVYHSLAVGAIAVAAVSVLAALTLLPAILKLLGDRVNALRPPFIQRYSIENSGRGFWARLTDLVMRRPLVSTTIAAGVLVVAAIPALNIQMGYAGISALPAGSESRQAFEILQDEFAGGMLSPVKIVVDGDAQDSAVQNALAKLIEQLHNDPAFADPSIDQSDSGDLVVVSVSGSSDPLSREAREAVSRVRGEYVPSAFAGVDADVSVTGQTAHSRDEMQIMATHMPFVFAFVLGLSFVLLLLLFRSIVVPLKAIIMNLLSVGAAYGLLVLVFQQGVGNEIFGFQRSETIESWLPLFLFAVLFGLSMDYHVFLLSRIKERFDETGDNADAVSHGMRSTSGLITGAALIMVTVFSGFAMGSLSSMQQMGFGLAVAVILDATIIRCVLVPASMQLLGERNWYLPRWMSWLPQISLEGVARECDCGPSFECPHPLSAGATA